MDKKSFLLVDDNKDSLSVLELYIESGFDNELITATSGNEAIEHLKKNPKIAIVISDYNMPEGDGGEIYKYITDNKLNIPFILLCGKSKDEMLEVTQLEGLFATDCTTYLKKPFNKSNIIAAINENLNTFSSPNEKPKALHVPEGYRKISIDNFFKYNIIKTDIYIKLSETKFVKIIHANDENSKAIIEKYVKRDMKHLFLKNTAYEKFLNSTTEKLSRILEEPIKNLEQTVIVQSMTTETIHESLALIGLSSESMELADKAVGTTLKVLKKAPKLNLLLSKMIQNKNFTYDLSMVCSYLSTASAMQIDLASESSYEKLAMASLMQDISLDDEKLVRINYIDSEEFEKLSKEDQKRIKDHPFKSVELLNEMDDFSNDCRNIILEHHELPESRGFPRKLNNRKISPLSCLMIISLHYGYRLLTEGNSEETLSLIKMDIREIFNLGNYKKACEGFFKALESGN